MKTLLISAVAAGLMAGAVFAGPRLDTTTASKAPTLMTDDQMDTVVAGENIAIYQIDFGQFWGGLLPGLALIFRTWVLMN